MKVNRMGPSPTAQHLSDAERRALAARRAAPAAASVLPGQAALTPAHLVFLQRTIGNQAVVKLLSASGRPTVVQRFGIDTMKQALGDELLKKHIGEPNMPDLSTREQQENALEAVYYHRPFDRGNKINDRRDKNTVFFADPQAIFNDLSNKYTGRQDLTNGGEYTTDNSYPAIDSVRVFNQKANKYNRALLHYGPAKPIVKINKDGNIQAFNHLQRTDPQTLANEVDLTVKDED